MNYIIRHAWVISCTILSTLLLLLLTSPMGAVRYGESPTQGRIFSGSQVTALLDASTYAAHCGGEVIVDGDDGEVLVAHCDH